MIRMLQVAAMTSLLRVEVEDGGEFRPIRFGCQCYAPRPGHAIRIATACVLEHVPVEMWSARAADSLCSLPRLRAGQSHMGEQIRIVDGTDRVQKQRDSCLVHAYAIALRLRGRVRVGAHTKIRAQSAPTQPSPRKRATVSTHLTIPSRRLRRNP